LYRAGITDFSQSFSSINANKSISVMQGSYKCIKCGLTNLTQRSDERVECGLTDFTQGGSNAADICARIIQRSNEWLDGGLTNLAQGGSNMADIHTRIVQNRDKWLDSARIADSSQCGCGTVADILIVIIQNANERLNGGRSGFAQVANLLDERNRVSGQRAAERFNGEIAVQGLVIKLRRAVGVISMGRAPNATSARRQSKANRSCFLSNRFC